MSDFYPTKGNEYFYIFGNAKINTTVKFLFGDFAEEIKNIRANTVNLLIAESEFATRGVKLRNSLLSMNISCHIIPIREDLLSLERYFALCGEKKELLACVGSPKFLDLAKKISKITGEKCLLVPTDCRTRTLLKTGDAQKLPDFVLLNGEFYNSPKKRYAAESFGEIISSSLDILDYKTASLCGKIKFDPSSATLLSEAVNHAVNIKKFLSPTEGLCFSGIKISLAQNNSEILRFSSSDKVANYLSYKGESGYGERKYRAFLSLLPLYKLYLLSDVSSFGVLPDYLKALKEASEWTGEKEYVIAEKFVKTDIKSSETRKRIKSVVKSSFIKEIEKLEKNLDYFEQTYSFLYGGRKKLSDYSPSDIKKALKSASFSTEGNLLAFMKDDGFSEFI